MMKLCPDVFPSTWVNPVLNYRRSATLTDPHPTATRQYVPKASHHPPNGGNSTLRANRGRLFPEQVPYVRHRLLLVLSYAESLFYAPSRHVVARRKRFGYVYKRFTCSFPFSQHLVKPFLQVHRFQSPSRALSHTNTGKGFRFLSLSWLKCCLSGCPRRLPRSTACCSPQSAPLRRPADTLTVVSWTKTLSPSTR